ncbi:unnamed protein product [Cylindrotheca closterium]|uniref:Uncharacterized protein n=1 Tax=Cylindrotheca closterium TaxID=2856 RepID=A0AAD2CUX4_9STRA|nr:unnamed protein product [Cylindrotheca closterium]
MLATVSPSTIPTTSHNQRRVSSFEHLSGQDDFHRMVLHANEQRRQNHGWSSTRSVSSCNTDDAGSTSTEHMSNTCGARERRQKEKRRFLSFTKVLMKFLEKKNPTVCKNARNVIRKYKKKSKNEEGGQHNYCGEESVSESMCESIKVPLKQTVGSAYWKQAKEEQRKNNILRKNDDDDYTDFEPLSLDSSSSDCLCENQTAEALSHFASSNRGDNIMTSTTSHKRASSYRRSSSSSCHHSKENHLVTEERKLRKQRFWMLVRVLMRYVEKKDVILYKKARATLENCATRNVRKEPRFVNLIESVQRELKHTVGTRYWRRAEHHVAKHILKKASEQAWEDALAKEASSFGSSLDNLFTPPVPLQEQPQQPQHEQTVVVHPLVLEPAFAPPPRQNHGSSHHWRDPSIPTNVAIPTKKLPAEHHWRLGGCDYYQSPHGTISEDIMYG